MPIPEQTPVNKITANGVTTSFPYTFKIFDDADLKVKVAGALNILTTDYTVAGAGVAGGGTVDFIVAPENLSEVVIYRDLSYKRDTDYINDLREAVLDDDLDRIVMLIQQLRQDLIRAIKLPVSETTDQLLSEAAVDRVDKLIGFDGSGDLVLKTLADVTNILSSVGFGLQVVGSELSLALPVRTVSVYPDTLTANDEVILATGTGTINIPQQSTVSTAAKVKILIIMNIGAGVSTLAEFTGDTLPETTLAAGESIMLIGNGGTIWREFKPVNINADTVAGKTPTATPAASVLPLAGTDGTLNAWAKTALRDRARNLILKVVTDTTVDVDADEIIAQDINGVPKRLTDVNLTMTMGNQWTSDSATKDGRGIGITEAINTFYYIWAVSGSAGDAVVATPESALAGALADVGTGYNTYGALLGVVRIGLDSKFKSLYQRDNKAVMKAEQVLSNGNATTYSETMTTAINTVVPLNAKAIIGYVMFERNGLTWVNQCHAYLACDDTGIGGQGIASFTLDHDLAFQVLGGFNLTLTEAQSIAYKVSSSQTKLQIYITGWEY